MQMASDRAFSNSIIEGDTRLPAGAGSQTRRHIEKGED
jgi:hypothetical protein